MIPYAAPYRAQGKRAMLASDERGLAYMLARTKAKVVGPPSTGPGSVGDVTVRIWNLKKEFQRRGGERVMAVNDVSLEISAGQLVVLLGPSGCGKTTLLRCIAGLEHPDAGRIEINGKIVFDAMDSILTVP